MRFRRLVKTNALHALRRQWSKAGAIALILMILRQLFSTLEYLIATALHVPNFIDPNSTPQLLLDDLLNTSPAAVALAGGTLLLSFVLLVPLIYGAQRWFYRTGDGCTEEVFSVFEFFFSLSHYFKAIWLNLCVVARCLLWAFVFLAPPSAMIYFAQKSLQQQAGEWQQLLGFGLEIAGAGLFVLMLIFLLWYLMRYYLVGFALADNPDEKAGALITLSVQASKGYCGALLLFELSMIGWRLLELLVIPKIFTYPYRTTAQGLYAHYLFERLRREKIAQEQGEASIEPKAAE